MQATMLPSSQNAAWCGIVTVSSLSVRIDRYVSVPFV